jgi:amino acid transporter
VDFPCTIGLPEAQNQCSPAQFKGIFLTSGKILHYGGPGGATLAYFLTGTIIWSVIASLGEMTALMPVKGPITEFATRYVDSAVGFATGWMYWFVASPSSEGPCTDLNRFAYVTVFAAQITASSSLMQFNYDNVLKWTFGVDISPVIWIFIFLAYMTSVNLFPVRVCAPAKHDEEQTRRTNELIRLYSRFTVNLNTYVDV